MSAMAQQRMNFLGQPLGCSLTTFKQRMALQEITMEDKELLQPLPPEIEGELDKILDEEDID